MRLTLRMPILNKKISLNEGTLQNFEGIFSKYNKSRVAERIVNAVYVLRNEILTFYVRHCPVANAMTYNSVVWAYKTILVCEKNLSHNS